MKTNDHELIVTALMIASDSLAVRDEEEAQLMGEEMRQLLYSMNEDNEWSDCEICGATVPRGEMPEIPTCSECVLTV